MGKQYEKGKGKREKEKASACGPSEGLFLRLCERRVRQELLIGEAVQKCDQVVPLGVAHRKSLQPRTLHRTLDPAGGIVVDDLRQRRDAAVVHVWRAHRNIAKRRRAEAAHVRGDVSRVEDAAIGGRIRAAAVEVE